MLIERFLELSKEDPDAAMLSDHNRTLTRAEVLDLAARTASLLGQHGVGSNTRIGLSLRDSLEFTIAYFGIWYFGACAVPLDFRTPADRRVALASDFRLSAVLEDRATPGLSESLVVDASWREARSRSVPVEPVADPTRPVVISLTSGTSGAPQGIQLDQARMFARMTLAHEYTNRRRIRHLSTLPLSYSGARNHMTASLLNGSAVVFRPPLFSIGEFVETIEREAITHAYIVPTIARGLLDLTVDRTTPLFPSVERLSVGGASLNPKEKMRFRVAVSKGFTETYSSGLTGNIARLQGQDVDDHPETAGRINTTVKLEIVDEADHPVPAGEAGRIRVQSPYIANSIIRSGDRASSERLSNGWAYPDDLGRIVDGEFLQILGRQSDLILRGGANVYPAEVERALSSVPGLHEIAVSGYHDHRLGEEVAAFFVADDTDVEGLLERASLLLLSPDKRPRRFVRLDALPRNTNGKVLRRKLRELMESGE